MRNYSTLTEEELLQYLRKGEEKAFTEIYNRYWEKLIAVGYYHTHDKQAAEDIVHEVMISLWTRKDELKIYSLHSYLATAVKFSVFKSIIREKRRRELLLKRNIPDHFSEVEEKLDARFLQEYLQGVVEQLPPKTKLVFSYSREDKLSVSEIAGKMDLSPKAVEYHMTKALKALRDKLGKIKFFFI
jgi:RNA polymerase sigma-70 factor (ECF subfamily)